MNNIKNHPAIIVSFVFCMALCLFSCHKKNIYDLFSPNGNLQLSVFLSNDSIPYWQITADNKPVMQACELGLICEDEDFSTHLKLDSATKIKLVSDSYKIIGGKKSEANYLANQKIYHFKNRNGHSLDIIFQLSNDGLAFRYYFPDSSAEIKRIVEEKSSFNFYDSTHTWIQPMAISKSGWCHVNPSYEEYYQMGVLVSDLPDSTAGWIFPALFKEGNTWMAITETAPDKDYCGSRLYRTNDYSFRVGFPDSTEHKEHGPVNPESTLPWYSPWRIIAISNNLAGIMESTLGTDLAPPAKDMDFSFVKPGRSSWSWVLLKDDSTIYRVQKKYIDFASKMGWEYCLIDAFWIKCKN